MLSTPAAASRYEAARAPRTLRSLLRFARRKPLGAIGGVIVVALLGIAVAAPMLAPHDPNEVFPGKRFVPPGSQFHLGTDNVGRDQLSAILWGSRLSLFVGLSSVLIGTTIGALLGVVSAYFGGTLDILLQRLVDTLMAFPVLVLALAIVAVLGSSSGNLVLAISLILIPQTVRVVRSAALAIKDSQYVEAARAVGCGDGRIVALHVLPQCAPPFLIIVSSSVGWAITVQATLGFLGVGAPPDVPNWGIMLSGAARQYAEKAPWMAVYPGLAISLAVYGFNLLGDALRDVLDPRLRH